MLTLNTIKAHPGATKKRKRLGRGSGSGHGPTAGKGDKGQLARSGGTVRPGFEGGQMPLYRRLPKRGFKSMTKARNFTVNLKDLAEMSTAVGGLISMASLRKAGLVSGNYDGLVVLGHGTLSASVEVEAVKFSGTAEKAILAAGGKVTLAK